MPTDAKKRGVLVASVALVAAVAGAGVSTAPALGQRWVRPVVTELESAPTLLPTTPPTPVNALLQSKISISPSGNFWATEVFADSTSSTTGSVSAAISGTRTGVDFAIAAGQAIPGIGAAFDSGPVGIDERVLVSDAGDVIISGNLNASAPSTADEIILRYSRSAGAYTVVAREGSPIGPVLIGESYGSDLVAKDVLADGRVSFYNSGTVGPTPAASDDFLFIGDGATTTFVVQSGVLTPTGQSAVPPLLVSAIQDEFGVSPDGQSSIHIGLLNRAENRQVAVLNGAVVLEQGGGAGQLPGPPGQSTTIVGISDVRMGPGGRWAAWGRATDTGSPWIVLSGVRVASPDDGFPTGSPGEALTSIQDGGFTPRGHFWFVGTTGFGRSVVVVMPVGGDPLLALSSGDLVDVDADGDPFNDATAVVHVFSAALADDGTMAVITRNFGPASAFNYDVIGFVRVPLPCAADFDGVGGATVDDIFIYLNAWFAGDLRADADRSGGLSVDDIFVFLNAWFAGCP